MLREYGLAYDVLIFERHLPQTIEFIDRYPNQVLLLTIWQSPVCGRTSIALAKKDA